MMKSSLTGASYFRVLSRGQLLVFPLVGWRLIPRCLRRRVPAFFVSSGLSVKATDKRLTIYALAPVPARNWRLSFRDYARPATP